MNMRYNINDKKGVSRTTKTVALYSAVTIFFGLLLGALYFWTLSPRVQDSSPPSGDTWSEEDAREKEIILNQIRQDAEDRETLGAEASKAKEDALRLIRRDSETREVEIEDAGQI